MIVTFWTTIRSHRFSFRSVSEERITRIVYYLFILVIFPRTLVLGGYSVFCYQWLIHPEAKIVFSVSYHSFLDGRKRCRAWWYWSKIHNWWLAIRRTDVRCRWWWEDQHGGKGEEKNIRNFLDSPLYFLLTATTVCPQKNAKKGFEKRNLAYGMVQKDPPIFSTVESLQCHMERYMRVSRGCDKKKKCYGLLSKRFNTHEVQFFFGRRLSYVPRRTL